MTAQRARMIDDTMVTLPGVGHRGFGHGGVAPPPDPGGGGYVLPNPFLIHDFASATGWFATNGGPTTISAESGAIVIADTSATSSSSATNHDVGTFADPTTWGVVALLSDLGGGASGADRDPELMLSGAPGFRIGTGGSGGIGGTFNAGAAIGENIATLTENIGDFWSVGNVAAMSGLPPAGVIGLRSDASVAPGGRFIRHKTMIGNAAGRPTVLIRVDDALASTDPVLLDMLDYYGFSATWFVPWADIGVKGGRLLLSQLQAIRDKGHAVCLNLTEADGLITDLADPAAVMAKVAEGRTWLATNGFAAEGGNFFVYSNGLALVRPTPVQVTGVSGSSGSAVLTMANTAGLLAGMRVVGVGIENSPATTIATVDSPTQITLSADLAASMSSGRIKAVDTGGAFYTRAMQDAMAAAGAKAAWTTLPGDFYSRYGVGNRALLLPANSTTSLEGGTIEGYVDTVISRGTTIQFYLHGITGTFDKNTGTDSGTASNGLTSGTGPLNAAFAYLKSKVDANLVDVETVPGWWARDCATPAVPPGL